MHEGSVFSHTDRWQMDGLTYSQQLDDQFSLVNSDDQIDETRKDQAK